jgi:hypothetical protein
MEIPNMSIFMKYIPAQNQPAAHQSIQARKVGLNKASGYGLALLLVFVASSVMIAASMSMTLAPTVAAALGTISMDGTSAKQVALVGLDAAQNDIKTQLAAGTAVTTSYRYPASGTTNVTMPTYPGSGASATVGNYYVTVTKARGFTYMLRAVGTVGSAVTYQYKLVQVNDSIPIPNSASGAVDPTAGYSLRRLLNSYAGSAVRVRCAGTGTTTDIGFTGSGDFDTAALRTCLGDTTLPLDIISAQAAYSLRRLSSTYSGYAIQVRRSSNNALQDIGFDTDGNLDTASLLTFVGSGSGYIRTWYDQSGNNRDVTQTTNSKQPRIVNAGALEALNNAPTVRFLSASSTTLTTTSAPLAAADDSYTYIATANFISPGGANEVLIEQNTSTLQNNKRAGLTDSGFSGESNDTAFVSWPTNALTQISLTVNNSSGTNITIYQNGSAGTGYATGSPGNLAIGANGFSMGSKYSTSNEFLDGYVSEVLVFDSVLSAGNRQSIEKSAGHYYNVSGMQDGFVTTWYDQSGNARNATQATTSKQPTLSVTGLVSTDGVIQPAVLFDGTDDYLATASSTAWPTGSSNRTLNALYQLNQTNIWCIVFGWGNTSTGQASYISHDPSRASGAVGFWGFNADLGTTLAPDANWGHRVVVNYSSSANDTVYVDGVSKLTGNVTLNTPASNVLWIAAGIGPGSYLPGSIAEILLYSSTLTTTQQTQLETNQTQYTRRRRWGW